MNLEIIKASEEQKAVIQNLIQFYTYDFSEFIKWDVEEDGLFAAYPDLEDYWSEKKCRFPYIIIKDGKYIGFALVRFIETKERSYFSMAEFFVMKKYRFEGMGKKIAKHIFNLHKGQWEVYQKESNKPAQIFWNKVIKEYTNGNFVQHFENGRLIQNFENLKIEVS